MKTSSDAERFSRYQSVVTVLLGKDSFCKSDIYEALKDEEKAFIGRVISELERDGYLTKTGLKTKPQYSWSAKKEGFNAGRWIDWKRRISIFCPFSAVRGLLGINQTGPLGVTWKRLSRKSTRPLRPDAEFYNIGQDLQDEPDITFFSPFRPRRIEFLPSIREGRKPRKSRRSC